MTQTVVQTGFFFVKPPPQLLKWIGSKQRSAPEIARMMPRPFNTYIEPFVGIGAVLGTIAPRRGLAGDILKPLIEIWHLVQNDPELLIDYYTKTLGRYKIAPKKAYLDVRESYNKNPNPLDLVFLSRACYGGVVRFTREGTMSTPMGPHKPISAKSFRRRVYSWRERVKYTRFVHASFEETMAEAREGDVVYCDPPYIYSQSILYGSQDFNVHALWRAIERCVSAGAKVLLSIDGKKKSGREQLDVHIPEGLFRREMSIDVGKSMLRRFQKEGETMEGEDVHDRLLLTW